MAVYRMNQRAGSDERLPATSYTGMHRETVRKISRHAGAVTPVMVASSATVAPVAPVRMSAETTTATRSVGPVGTVGMGRLYAVRQNFRSTGSVLRFSHKSYQDERSNRLAQSVRLSFRTWCICSVKESKKTATRGNPPSRVLGFLFLFLEVTHD